MQFVFWGVLTVWCAPCAQAAEEASAASELLAKAEAAFEELRLAEAVAAEQGKLCLICHAFGRSCLCHTQ